MQAKVACSCHQFAQNCTSQSIGVGDNGCQDDFCAINAGYIIAAIARFTSKQLMGVL